MSGPVYDIERLSFESADEIEYLLTNRFGGYSSQTILGTNTRKYHGLLAAGYGGLERRLVIDSMLEELRSEDADETLYVRHYGDIADTRGLKNIKQVECGKNFVKTMFEVGRVSIFKTLTVSKSENAIKLGWEIANQGGKPVNLLVRPLFNSRNIHEIGREGRDFKHSFADGVLDVSTSVDHIRLWSNEMEFRSDPSWHRNNLYPLERRRGESYLEDVFTSGTLIFRVDGKDTGFAQIIAKASLGKDDFNPPKTDELDSPMPYSEDNLRNLKSSSESFIVDVGGHLSVIAGYHWFMDWGRDTMISLPGLTYVTERVDEGVKILDRFISAIKDGRIPTRFTESGPIYYDFDGTLWMLDRIKLLKKYAESNIYDDFIDRNWLKLKTIYEGYKPFFSEGILHNKKGTWMDTLNRDSAIEVQGLWINGLSILQELSDARGDDLDLSDQIELCQNQVFERFYNGYYLRDCLGDDAFRPNQVIYLSLENVKCDKKVAKDILNLVFERLYTPYGLKTLSFDHPDYKPEYIGGPDERENCYHNGTIWPWLIGPYCKSLRLYYGRAGMKKSRKILEALMKKTGQNCAGTLNEIYDAQTPHRPRGAISQAWSVAELIRSWHEDTAL